MISDQGLTHCYQPWNGYVRRLSEKFERQFDLPIDSSQEHLVLPKSHSYHGRSEERKKDALIVSLKSARTTINNNAHGESSSIIRMLIDYLSNKDRTRVLKQILIGSAAGTLTGSLLGQRSDF